VRLEARDQHPDLETKPPLATGAGDSSRLSEASGSPPAELRPDPTGLSEQPHGEDWARHARPAFVLTFLGLGANLLTGILIARSLGTSGRGELAAILTAPQLIGWAFALGCVEAVAFHHARRPADGGRLLGTWLAIFVPVGFAAVVIGEFALGPLLAAQSEETLDLARLVMLTVVFDLVAAAVYGVILGDQDFLFYNVLRFAHPAAIGCAYATLWAFDVLSVEAAVATNVVVSLTGLLIGGVRVLRRHGLAAPSRSLARSTLWYGLRAHGTNISGLANLRLDMLIIPAFLGAASVGLYSVATNVSWIIFMLAGALVPLALPAAARQGERGPEVVIRWFHLTVAFGIVAALAMALVAEIGVRLIYGASFADSVLPLRLLLPGTVVFAAAGVLASGLYALNRPLTAAIPQIAGLVITVGGLLLFLEDGGITAAAIISTLAYSVVFLATLVLYRRAADLGWREFLPSWAAFRPEWRMPFRVRS
jgi:O-antigen/teichoic acid export membrane protein